MMEEPVAACGHKGCGCHVTECCLNCPLPDCIWTANYNNNRSKERGRSIALEYIKGQSISALMSKYGLTRITVRRAIRRYEKEVTEQFDNSQPIVVS